MSEPIRVLELRSVRGTGGGPEKTILAGAARSDSSRFAITVCYIRDARDPIFNIDAKAANLGVDYVELRERHSLDVTIWRALRTLVRERRIDIVHAHEYKTDLLAFGLARAEPIAALATVHGWTGHSSRERWVYYPVDKRLLARFPKLIAVSSEIRHELLRHGARAERVSTVLNGIDHLAFHRDRARERPVREQLKLGASDLVIGAVGRLEPQKRFDLLIDVVARLRSTRPTVKLLIVGDGSLTQALLEQVRRAGLEDVCRLLGQRGDVVDLHHAFDVFVQSSDYEGTSNAVLEAMALETPVVATSAGGTEDIVRDRIDGLIVPTGDPTRLLEAIEEAFHDPSAAQRRAAAARRRVETDLSFAARMSAVEAIYAELAKHRADLSAHRPVAARV